MESERRPSGVLARRVAIFGILAVLALVAGGLLLATRSTVDTSACLGRLGPCDLRPTLPDFIPGMILLAAGTVLGLSLTGWGILHWTRSRRRPRPPIT